MSALAFNRQDVADACVAYARLHPDGPFHAALSAGKRDRARDLAQTSYFSIGRDDTWDTLQRLEDSAREHYFALVAKRDGQKQADELRANYERIGDPAGVEIQIHSSEDDPYQVTFIIQDEIADAWADAHGSLDGGTWECADGPGFVYDHGFWTPTLFEELRKEGFNLDFSQWYGDPDENDERIARHAGECDECSGDFSRARDHVEESEGVTS